MCFCMKYLINQREINIKYLQTLNEEFVTGTNNKCVFARFVNYYGK